MMSGKSNRFTDNEESRAELELRRLMADMPAEAGPSQAYWDMYATRVMARIAREESAPARPAWKLLWKPIASLATMALAVSAFVMLRPIEPTLDQTMASMGNDDVLTVRQSDAPIVPVSSGELTAADDLKSVDTKNVDVDAVLAFGTADADQISALAHATAFTSETFGMDNLSDDDANAIISNLKTSL